MTDNGAMASTEPSHFDLDSNAVLRRTVREPVDRLDIIHTNLAHLTAVTLQCDEVASLCPVSDQPDFSAVTVVYLPADGRIIESKSLKLFLWSFRDRGVFCEGLAEEIGARVWQDAQPQWVRVTVRQGMRGGIVTTAIAEFGEPTRNAT